VGSSPPETHFSAPHFSARPVLQKNVGQKNMGFTYNSPPAGLTFLGRLFSEQDLIKFVYSYEQATEHRRPPEKFPPLKGNEE
jgi:hypothetical protein